MLIGGDDGVAVRLRPLRWQFPADAGAWDDRWLVIGGAVEIRDQAWSFTDPCLLIEEAHELADWLRTAAAGRGEPSLSFMEPALGFAIAGRSDTEVVLRVRFTAEAAPPWLRADNPHSAQCTAELRLRPAQLLAAATAWSRELEALPSRSFADRG
ncbi:hypothetical protein ODJ79_02180 [Actinoplanes sp. KI2]|uniref:WapI family immunity protein n=1 Tax=Actinoplanes sp. KI2 TaxID=2983315 RepID=UPI0021D59B19|nr:hypothetical protein [Actinoplanes sp. KI2]MCU7722513.1 hypothetical protein [Actinoplanes sp. KI2]